MQVFPQMGEIWKTLPKYCPALWMLTMMKPLSMSVCRTWSPLWKNTLGFVQWCAAKKLFGSIHGWVPGPLPWGTLKKNLAQNFSNFFYKKRHPQKYIWKEKTWKKKKLFLQGPMVPAWGEAKAPLPQGWDPGPFPWVTPTPEFFFLICSLTFKTKR